jgi:hypothetical protein
MSSKNRPPIRLILLGSVLIGVLIAFGYEPLYEMLSNFMQARAKLGSLHELIVTLLLGAVYLGLLIYFFTIFVAGGITRKIFYYLLSEMRKKELLPVTFKMKHRRGFVHIYQDINKILELFIRNFMEVKQDKDKFVKAVEMHLDPTVKEHLDGMEINEMYLRNKKKTATILFSDLRGFTAFTETHEAGDVITILNDYLTESTKIISRHKGKVNKYIGDSVMAVFEEAPKYSDYLDCDEAIIAALDMQTQYQLLLKKWKDTIDPAIAIGLGIEIGRAHV